MAGAAMNAGVVRYGFQTTIERASSEDGKFRVRGVANTFNVMRSGRILHPAAVEAYVKANPRPSLPLLAQHGVVGGGFATVGRVDVLRVDRGRGLYFEAELAAGSELSEEAKALIEQRMLRTLSLGWSVRQSRWVRRGDADIDPFIAEKMDAAGVDEAMAFIDWEPVEISLVDVPDDPGALLAAGAGPAVAGEVAALQCEVSALRHELNELRAFLDGAEGASYDLAALQETVREATDEVVGGLRARVLEILDDEEIAAAAGDAQARTFETIEQELAHYAALGGRGAGGGPAASAAPPRASWPGGVDSEADLDAFLKRMGETAE